MISRCSTRVLKLDFGIAAFIVNKFNFYDNLKEENTKT